jgi:peptidoglycan L-alanyl-D-glutamate endopeptidase CwlK
VQDNRVNSTETRLNFIYMISKLVIEANLKKIKIMPTAFYRSPEEVRQLFLEGKSEVDGYIKKSKHQLWRAMDFVVIKEGVPIWTRIPEYETLGQIWENMGGVWGGRWKSLNDVFHFEI